MLMATMIIMHPKFRLVAQNLQSKERGAKRQRMSRYMSTPPGNDSFKKQKPVFQLAFGWGASFSIN